jgi:fluoride ion exporter CrcB/FEX
MNSVVSIVTIAGSGAAGALIRLGLLHLFNRSMWRSEYATVTANILGSAGAGFVIAADWGIWSWLLTAGLFGAITTLSTLAVDVAEALRAQLRQGWSLLGWHILGGLAGFLVGYLIASVAL